MNEIENLKLRWPTILWISLTAIISSIGIPLLLKLIEDSNAFQDLKADKPIDNIISILSMPALSIPVFAFALLIASIFLNLFLFKRMNIYFKACNEFGKLFYKTALKLSKISKHPIKVELNKKELIIDYNSLKNNRKI